ncbi:MAG: ECF transporter S component [Lachnospiraceae bacterium]|nr:ECF transporter S component [Lachnospiraceae bacterium]
MKNGIGSQVIQNAMFVVVCLVTVAALILVAWLFERIMRKKNGDKSRILSTKKIAMIGMFSAISGILYCFDFALPIAPTFYKLDFSELPALICGFAFGPVAGVLVEFLKVVIKLLFKSTSTAFVGDLANFLIGCMLVLTASVIYGFKKTKKMSRIALLTGVIVMTVFGTWFNAVYLLPTFSTLYGLPLDSIIAMGTAINGSVNNIYSFVIIMVAPMNIIKGTVVSVLTLLVYKKLSRIIK